ncbi:peptide transporter family 1-like [Panulirus ornatus]|uniref:peptide transporter family 1-like n=1 Tax=Panulirus ornatus TaxID=150431 RepID=UPI003A869F60
MASGSEKLRYPRGIFFILAGYLLERFVYYGLFGGAVLYMQRMLGFTAASAKTTKAVMEGLIYLAPIAGAALADTYLGKTRTVFFMCCGYTVGAAVYMLSSLTPIMATVTAAKFTGILGLLVLGLCAGLMKAAYSSLGADQFKIPEQRHQQERFFYAFYWMINAGAFLGMFMTAQLRSSVQCFGDDCYFLPYIILVGSMVVSTVIFAAGRSRYVEAPPDAMLINSFRCIYHAIRKSYRSDRKPVDHWLDRADDQFDAQLLKDVKVTLRVLLLFCTYPLFWALFYQTSTGMIFQAKRLDGLVGSYRIPPEMSSTVNPFLILTLIPLFDLVIYPLCNHFGILKKTTTRMITGMCFAMCAFVLYALLNMQVEQTFIPASHARLHVYNALPCQVTVQIPKVTAEQVKVENGGQVALSSFTVTGEEVEVQVTGPCLTVDMSKVRVSTLGGHETTFLITPEGAFLLPPTLEYIKDEDAEAKVRVLVPGGDVSNVTLKFDTLEEYFEVVEGKTEFKRLSPKEYVVLVAEDELGDAPIYQDGVYDVVIINTDLYLFPVTRPANVHMLWLFPQYLFITIGEVLFSVSSMDFAYSQAPMAMKSFLQAANLFTITVGLWLFAGLTSLNTVIGAFDHRASHEAFLYAGLMAANIIIFVLLLRKYYSDVPATEEETKDTKAEEVEQQSQQQQQQQQQQPSSHDNPAFVDDHSV